MWTRDDPEQSTGTPVAQTLAEALEREHRQIDQGIETFTSGGPVEALTEAVRALRRHIYLEEEFLFPALREDGLIAPVFVMVREHGQVCQTLESLDEALARSAADASVRDLCATLLAQLAAHNLKEERILYPRADETLTAPALAALKEFLDTGQLPGGWVCEAERS